MYDLHCILPLSPLALFFSRPSFTVAPLQILTQTFSFLTFFFVERLLFMLMFLSLMRSVLRISKQEPREE